MTRTQDIAPSGFTVERVRKNFLDTGELSDAQSRGIRREIANSWKRSRSLGVDPERLTVQEGNPQRTDENLLHYADRVLMRAAEQMCNEPVSILFATPDGGVVRRYCTDSSLSRQLDSVDLAPGSGYDEETVGTNGIGTALESTRPTVVNAFEHFNEKLAVFACAGAPVVHPVTGSLLGVVNLTCLASQLNNLLLTVASSLADQIAQHVFADYGGDFHLMRDYLSACRHASGPVIARGGEVLMMNRHSQQMLTPEDQTALLIHSAECADVGTDHSIVTDLPSGITARLESIASVCSGRVVGDIIRVRLGSTTLAVTEVAGRGRTLPGLVGSSPQWLHTSGQVLSHARKGESLVIEGEESVGKSSLVRAAHGAVHHNSRFVEIDCVSFHDTDELLSEVDQELTDGDGTLLLRGIDRLDAEALGGLSELLIEQNSAAVSNGPRWIVATRTSSGQPTAVDTVIVPCFDFTVTVPSLRHRPEDIPDLAERFLRRAVGEGGVRFSSDALRKLARLPFPGNLDQLADVVRECVQVRRVGEIALTDLPAQCTSATRRSLTTMEALQRDAVVDALRAHKGRKKEAAEHLGISRATIYRKIREFSIDIRT